METRPLGRTDLRLSEISLGTWGLAAGSYGPVDPTRFEETVGAALEKGITTFDCAPTWGDDAASERTVGEVLKAHADIETVVVTRGGRRLVDGLAQASFSEEDLIADAEASLERLGRETLDLWLLHNPSLEQLQEDGWQEATDKLAADGKVRAWGVSVGRIEEARVALKAGAQALCLPFNLLSTDLYGDLKPDIKTSGAGVLARSPLDYGILSGQWGASRTFGDDDHRGRRWSGYAKRERLRQIDRCRFLVGADHADMTTVALRYVLSEPRITTALVGARTPYQAVSAAAASDDPGRIAEPDLRRLAKVRGVAGF